MRGICQHKGGEGEIRAIAVSKNRRTASRVDSRANACTLPCALSQMIRYRLARQSSLSVVIVLLLAGLWSCHHSLTPFSRAQCWQAMKSGYGWRANSLLASSFMRAGLIKAVVVRTSEDPMPASRFRGASVRGLATTATNTSVNCRIFGRYRLRHPQFQASASGG